MVGVKRNNDEKVVLFVQTPEASMDPELETDIQAIIKKNLSPRHCPNYVFNVRFGFPYTSNGKKIELDVKKLLNRQQIEVTEPLKPFLQYIDLIN